MWLSTLVHLDIPRLGNYFLRKSNCWENGEFENKKNLYSSFVEIKIKELYNVTMDYLIKGDLVVYHPAGNVPRFGQQGN